MLIEESKVNSLFDLLILYIKLPALEKLKNYFHEVKDFFSSKEINEKFNYIPKTAYFSEKAYTIEEVPKKRNNQYTKFNVPQRWLNHAWDIIGSIKNSRKSFIFSRYNDDANEKNKIPHIGIENLEMKLRERTYTAFSDFEKDLSEMFEITENYWKRTKRKYFIFNLDSENSMLCQNISSRMKKQIDKLKKENKLK